MSLFYWISFKNGHRSSSLDEAAKHSPTILSLSMDSWFSSSSRWPADKNCQLRTCDSCCQVTGWGSANIDRFCRRGFRVRFFVYQVCKRWNAVNPQSFSVMVKFGHVLSYRWTDVEMCWLYLWFTGRQHVTPQERSPGIGDLTCTGDDNHRQGADLDQHERRRPVNCLATIFSMTSAMYYMRVNSPRCYTPVLHAATPSQT